MKLRFFCIVARAKARTILTVFDLESKTTLSLTLLAFAFRTSPSADHVRVPASAVK